MSEELPSGWKNVTIGEVAEINPRHPKGLADSLIVSFARMAAISDDQPDFQELEERPLGTVRKGFTHFADGDVLFAKITPCMENGKGAVAVGLRNGRGCGTTELHVIRPTKLVDPLFLYRFLSQPSIRKQAKEAFTGTAGQARVPSGFIETLELPLPPIAEQKLIATKLDELMSDIRACRSRLERIPAILIRFRQSLLAAACSGLLTADSRREELSELSDEIPRGWNLVSCGDVLREIRYGTATKCSPHPKGTPVLRIPNITSGRIDHSDLKYGPLSAQERQRLLVEAGDVLLIRSNGSVSLVGRTALVTEHERGFAFAGYLMRLRADQKKIHPSFLNLALSAPAVRAQIEQHARSTSGVNNINSDEVRRLELLLPPLSEQQEIVRRVEDLLNVAERIQLRYAKAIEATDKITPSILSKAFRGELLSGEA